MSSLFGIGGGGNVGAAGGGGILGSHAINQSLRFNDDDSAYLSRTPASAGNRKTWTWSAWVKRGTLASNQALFSAGTTSPNYAALRFTSDDKIQFFVGGAATYSISTTAVYRDVSSWYHIVFTFDVTESTASNRCKLYVNGTQQTLSGTFPTNADWEINNTYAHAVGAQSVNAAFSLPYDGYMAEVNFIDGTALDPTSFGETINGIWVPKQYSGSYGTNGFYLPSAQDTANGASAFFDQDDNGYIAWTDPGTQYEIGASDDFTVEFFFNPTTAEVSGGSNLIGYYSTTSPAGYFMVNLNISTRKIYLYYGNGTAYTFSTFANGAVVAGQWHHIAINRNSGTITCWLDGSQVGSTQNSNTKTFDIPEFRVNKAHATSNTTFDGYISNVRLVVGSAVYANGSTITVPTSTLTNITNTRILACTTTTLTQDASSNNVTGTVTSAIASSFSPFADFNFYDDTSGNTNNFTANNLAVHDVVLDSPTNNFATLNPLQNSGGGGTWFAQATLSEGNLKASLPANSVSCATMKATGKLYAEVRWSTIKNELALGLIIPEEYTTTTAHPTNTGANSWRMAYSGGAPADIFLVDEGTSVANPAQTVSAGDIFQVAWDTDSGEIWFGYNNSWYDSSGGTTGNPSTGANPTMTATTADLEASLVYIACGNNTGVGTINFGQDSTFAGAISAGGNADANGIGDFAYAPPTDYLCLAASSLSEPTISPKSAKQADDYFNTVLYTGDGSSSNAITGVGFQPDWTWIKTRNGTASHALFDSVRGADNVLRSNGTDEENASAISTASFGGLTSFDSDGFTVDDGSDGTFDATNGSGDTYVSWNWKAGGTAASNTDGSITSQVSAAPEAGFSIISWTGSGADGNIGHGLTQTPEFFMTKDLNNSRNWEGFHKDITAGHVLYLNLDIGQNNAASTYFQGGYNAANDTTIALSSYLAQTGRPMIGYAFHSVDGYSKVGKYVGNNSADGSFSYTGFRPAFVIIKRTDSTAGWVLYDNKRDTYNQMQFILWPNLGNAEYTSNLLHIDFLSNGFKVRNDTYGETNASGGSYIYLAFAEAPFKYANAR